MSSSDNNAEAILVTSEARAFTTIDVIDPDSGLSVEIQIYKHENGGLFGIDSSFLVQAVDTVDPEDDDSDAILWDPFAPTEPTRGAGYILLPLLRLKEDEARASDVEEVTTAMRNLEQSAVRAWAYRDDHAIEFEFNAAPWLQQASINEIIALAKCSWGGDYAADSVAEESAELLKGTDQGDKLSALFTFTSPKEGEGFECHLNLEGEETNLTTWLRQFRPDAFHSLKELELLPLKGQFR